jgi:hypothetical protein
MATVERYIKYQGFLPEKECFRSQGKTVKILVIEEMDQKYTKEVILVDMI